MSFIKKNGYIIVISLISISALIFLSCEYFVIPENEYENILIIKDENKIITPTPKVNEKVEEVIFTSSEIPDNILKKMIGNSIPEDSVKDVKIDELSYLKVTYWGFDEKTHIGELIVNKKVSQEVLDIFQEVYENKYPIEKMRLIDEYGADDEKSMQDNNTSAFCYRVVKNTNKLSSHSLGIAIDVNPLYNPYVQGEKVQPITEDVFVNRDINVRGIIKKGDSLYNAFIKRGWTWGGDWKTKKDYQHFEK